MDYTPHLKACPLAEVHRRLDHVHKHWHQAFDNYFNPEEFLFAAQSCIQTLRTVTFLLQSKKRELEGFDKWYEPWRTRMREDEIMRWSVVARNQIEKQGDLETESTVSAEIVASHLDELPIAKVSTSICDAVDDIFSNVPRALLRDHILEHGTLKVERRWVESNLPHVEVLEATAHVYGFLSLIISDAHRAFGLPTFDQIQIDHEGDVEVLNADRPHLNGRLPCMVALSEHRSIHVSLKTGEEVGFVRYVHSPTEEHLLAAAEKYGLDTTAKEGHLDDHSIEILATHFFDMARTVFIKDGYHVFMALLIGPGNTAVPMELRTAERSDKYLMMRIVADEVERSGADAVIFINEVWRAAFDPGNPYRHAGDAPEKKEFLVLTAASATEEGLTLSAEIIRDGALISLGETDATPLQGGENFLGPILQVWRQRS